jgi:hypothetical protein
MLKEYVPNILVVSFLCYSKCFHVASICFKCFIYFRLMLHSSVSCSKCFVLQRYVVCLESHGGHGRTLGQGAWRAGANRWDA